jgi:hypothetical protein
VPLIISYLYDQGYQMFDEGKRKGWAIFACQDGQKLLKIIEHELLTKTFIPLNLVNNLVKMLHN